MPHEIADDGPLMIVHLTAQAVDLLTELDPFEHGIGDIAATWVQRWCRGHYTVESVERVSWPTTTSLPILMEQRERKHLLEVAHVLGRTPGHLASTIINERARNLLLRKNQGLLT